MKLYTTCPCGRRIKVKKRDTTTDDSLQEGRLLEIRCSRCNRTFHRDYYHLNVKTWGAWRTVIILSLFILGSVGLMGLLQWLGANLASIVWIPFAALVVYGLLGRKESDAVEQYRHADETMPPLQLTPKTAALFSDEELLDWYSIDEYQDICNEQGKVLYYCTPIWDERDSYFDCFYYVQWNGGDGQDDGTELYESLMAVGATQHAAIVIAAREVFRNHAKEIQRCAKSTMKDGYKELQALRLFTQQNQAFAEADRKEPLVPLVAKYIRANLEYFN